MSMRIIICLLLLFCTFNAALAQTPADKTVKPVKTEMPSKTVKPVKTEMPSKTEMQSQMNEATNEIRKEIADLEKQIASSKDADEIKDLNEQVAILKKQLSMMEGLNKNMAGMSEKVFKAAGNEDTGTAIPKRDATRISMIPKKIATDAELLSFLKNVNSGVERLISPAERTEALNIYSETKAKYKSVRDCGQCSKRLLDAWPLGKGFIHYGKSLYR